ncbi:MAG: hypothetical protein M0042_07680 [Nitrospiraceae bacterium]|nr:hypothetical protein [Nitrospiraceae bacterium]
MDGKETSAQDGRIVYVRTESGNQEIQFRLFKLSQLQRAVLILVNGQNNRATILSQFPKVDAAESLVELERRGLIGRKQEPWPSGSLLNAVEQRQTIQTNSIGDYSTPFFMTDTFWFVLIIIVSLVIVTVAIYHIQLSGISDLITTLVVIYLLPLTPTVLLYVSKRKKLKSLMNASLIVGTLPSLFTIVLIVGSAQGG